MPDLFSSVCPNTALASHHDPRHPALIDGTRTLSYGELHAAADRIARFLRARGADEGSVVGLLLPRSIQFAVAALGVRKAGAAYLPLDPGYPRARFLQILTDANPFCVFGNGGAPNWPSFMPIVPIDSPEIAACDAGELPGSPLDESLAYILYTSGTTGEPKGVCVTNGNLRHLVDWHRDAFALAMGDRIAFLASISFDAAVWELWPALAAGATLLLPPEELKRSPELLRDWFVAERITVAFVPTPLAERMLRLPWPAETALRTMLTGGDTLRHVPPPGLPFRLHNNYGPAECTVVSTSGEVLPGDGKGLPSIGWPLPGVTVALLDEQGREVPDGSTGEISIGGPGVARGYLRRPALTAEKFIEVPGRGRLYRSGDQGRRRPNGSLEFGGRMDAQVKIHGYRVELGEVEGALHGAPGVRECVVDVREDTSGEYRLIAYVVGANLSREAIRQALLSCLPAHEVPSEFVVLGELPLTAHGKFERVRLPAPVDENILKDPDAASSFIERELIAMLKEYFHVGGIGRDDNFFFLGGHSFAAAQIMARIRARFHVEMSLRAIFDHPTPAGMALEVERLIELELAKGA